MDLDTLSLVVGFFLGALFLFIAGYLYSKQKVAALSEKWKLAETANQRLEGEHKNYVQQIEASQIRAHQAESKNELLQQQYTLYLQLQETHQQALTKNAELLAQLKYNREKLDNQQNDILRLREQFRLEFSELSQKLLEAQSKKFTEANEVKMKSILEPLQANLSAFKTKVEETYDKESKERFSLAKEVHRLVEMSQLVSREANNLATALKTNNKLQGNWGEMILESLLENSGLTRGREYFVQEFIRDTAGNMIRDENGKGLQPDVTILYPDQRKVIIDSKVSLIAWEQYTAAEERESQHVFIKEHILSIRNHIESLSKKNYPKYAMALDYVLLFIPIEPAFLEAVKIDVQLWKYAYEKKILLVSPTNLFSVLKIIADLWKVEQQNKNAIEIANRAGALYDKFCGFVENLELLGKKLNDAQNHFADAFKQLSTGRGNLVSRVEDLKEMGAKASKQIPPILIAKAEE